MLLMIEGKIKWCQHVRIICVHEWAWTPRYVGEARCVNIPFKEEAIENEQAIREAEGP
jgi:hypothetical protein